MPFVNRIAKKNNGRHLKFIIVNNKFLKKPCNIRQYRPLFIMVKNKLDFWTIFVNNFDICVSPLYDYFLPRGALLWPSIK